MLTAISDHEQMTDDMEVADVSTCVTQSVQATPHYVFEELQNKYSQRLFKQILAITRHYEDAEDALQDALYKAYVALPLFEDRCHIYTWMSRIAINCALMKVRKRKHRQELSLVGSEHTDDIHDPGFELPHPGWSPEEICGSEEIVRRIANVVESLDPLSKQVILLRADEDYSMKEIAGTLNMSVSAVKARLSRARHVLRFVLPDPFRAKVRGIRDHREER